MKIIANTEPGYLVSMTKSELEKLTGFYYGKSVKFFIGKELLIDAVYNQLQYLVNQEEEIKKISHSLKTAYGMLEKIDPVFHKDPR